MTSLPALAANLWLVGFPVVAMAAATLALLGQARGRWRYLVALTGFLAAAVAPFAATTQGAPVVRDAVDGADRTIPTATSREPSASTVEVSAPWLMPGSESSVARGTRPNAASAAGAGAGHASLLPALVVAVWLGGAALLLARELLAHLRLARARHGWVAADDALRRSCRVRAGRRLYLADVASPRTHGLAAPAIVLPRAVPHGVDRRVLRLIVAHEEAHARWRDPLVHAAVRLVRSLLWIAPPLWIAERLVAREREAAADEAALRGERDELCTRYAAALVAFGRLACAREEALAVRLGAASDLEYRVRRILRLSRRRFLRVAAGVVVLAAGALALGFAPRAQTPGPVTVVAARSGVTAQAQPARQATTHPDYAVRVPAEPSLTSAAATAVPALGDPLAAATDGSPPPLAPSGAAGKGASVERSAAEGAAAEGAAVEDPAANDNAASDNAAEAGTPVVTQPHRAVAVDSAAAKQAALPPPGPPSASAAVGGELPRDGEGRRDTADIGADAALDRAHPGARDATILRDDDIRVIRDRIVIREVSDRMYRERVESDGRSKHPVALFHRAVTAPLKRWLRARGEAPPPAPPAGEAPH